MSLSLLLAVNAHADNSRPYSLTASTQTVYNSSGRPLDGMENFFSFWNGRLPAEDQKAHVRAISMALNNLDNGEVAEWYSRTSTNQGMVVVVYTYDAGVGYCRVFQSLVTVNGTARQYQETACIQQGTKGWVYYNK